MTSMTRRLIWVRDGAREDAADECTAVMPMAFYLVPDLLSRQSLAGISCVLLNDHPCLESLAGAFLF
jgi:hypothetical protein